LIRWIIFDMMGVIFKEGDDVNNLLIPYLQKKNPAFRPNKVREIYIRASAGEISSQEFWTQLGYGGQYPAIEEEFLNPCFTLDGEFIPVVREVHKKFHTAVLSNDLSDWSNFLREKYGLNSLFDVVVISGDVGCRKPDRRIFEILLQKLDAPAHDCVFIDDKRINLATALDLGFSTVQFVRGVLNDRDQKFPPPQHQIRSFTELPALLDSIE
jgi:putative hydrolase of the HAD superfamily